MERTVEIPGDVDVELENGTFRASSGDANVEKRLDHPEVSIYVEDSRVVITTDSGRRDVRSVVGTYRSIVENAITGVYKGFEYRLKGFYSHFPMDMEAKEGVFVISNFIGERAPREVKIPEGVEVSVEGEDVSVRGADREVVGQTAANIENACYKGDRDPRKFQDGIYITEKVVRDEQEV